MKNELCVQTVPLFQALSHDNQEIIEQLVFHKVFQRGEIVLTPQDDQRLVIVKSGQLISSTISLDGQESFQNLLNSGEFAGDDWLFGAVNHDVFLRAKQKTEICYILSGDFKELLFKIPKLNYELLKLSVNRTIQQQRRIRYMSIGHIENRLRTYFIDLVSDQQSTQVTIPFSLIDFASYLGTTPETLSRRLGKLIEQKFIERVDLKTYIVQS